MTRTLVVLALAALLAAGAASAQISPRARMGAPNTEPPPSSSKPSSSAASLSDGARYEADVRDRLAYFQTRLDALDGQAGKLGKVEKQAFQWDMKRAKEELAAARSLQGRLQSAKADRWAAVHDAIESSFQDVSRIYGRMLLQLPDDVVASVFPFSTGSETRARAAETTRPDGKQPQQDVDLSAVPTATPYAAHVRERVQRIETKLVALDNAIASSSSQAQERGREITSEIRRSVRDVVLDASQLASATGKEEWNRVHDDIEAGLDDVAGAFALATETLERDHATAKAANAL